MALSDEDVQRYIRDVQRQQTTAQLANWLADTRRITDMVAHGNEDVIPVFWIRIFGVLADISDFVADHLSVVADNPVLRDDPRMSALQFRQLQEALVDLLRRFTDDEIIYLQYRRHCDAHPLQHAYRIRLRNDRLHDQVRHRLLGVELTVEETRKALRELLSRYEINEKRIALDFATRSLEPIEIVRRCSISCFGDASVAHTP